MSKARDLANLASTATVMATDAELSAATASLASTGYVDAKVAAADSTPIALMTMGA